MLMPAMQLVYALPAWPAMTAEIALSAMFGWRGLGLSRQALSEVVNERDSGVGRDGDSAV